MGDIVKFERPASPTTPTEREQALFAAYVAARNKADETLQINDAIAAGKAWAVWLDHFRAICP